MSDNRKTAKKLLLVNWSCFQNETIRLESSTLFTGVNGTGKTTILDAMAYLLTANTQFNKAADDKDRSVTAYIHGDRKTNGSDRYLRKGEVTSYIAMEFYSPIDKSYFVVAVCIESRSEQDRAESKWLCIQNAGLEEINFCVINDGKQITTSRNNLCFKGQRFKSSDFLGRDKAIPQITRALGIRGDYKKYREKLVKMMAFDPERNVDKFLQDSVLSNNNEVNSLKQLREQKELYEKAKQMFDDMKQRKVLLEQIEEKTCDYEKALRSKNIREMMFEYQHLNANKIRIEEINIKIKNLELEKKDLEKKNQQSQKELEIARKQLSDAENKNHDITETLEKLEDIRKSHSEKIEFLKIEIAKLKQLQIALKQLSEILKSYFEIAQNQRTILENLAETDFSLTEKRSVFIDFSQKVLAQKDLFIKEQGREEDRLKELKNSLTEIESNIKKLESNVVIFPHEAEIAKRTIKSEFEKRGIKSDVRFFAELVESLTDESLTTFNRVSKKDTLFVYLSGYHNSAKQKFLVKVFNENPNKKYFHFGDIDLDGFLILENLKTKTKIDFIPFCMNVEMLKKYSSYSKKLEQNDIVKANGLVQRNLYTDVMKYMLQTEMKLEQEIIGWLER